MDNPRCSFIAVHIAVCMSLSATQSFLIKSYCHQVSSNRAWGSRGFLTFWIYFRVKRQSLQGFTSVRGAQAQRESSLWGVEKVGNGGLKIVIFCISADSSLSVQWDQVVTRRAQLSNQWPCYPDYNSHCLLFVFILSVF